MSASRVVKTKQSITGRGTSIWCVSSLPISVVGKNNCWIHQSRSTQPQKFCELGPCSPLALAFCTGSQACLWSSFKKDNKNRKMEKSNPFVCLTDGGVIICIAHSGVMRTPSATLFQGKERACRERKCFFHGHASQWWWWWWCITQILSYSSS